MRITLIKQDRTIDFCFTDKTNGIYWIYDYDKNNTRRNLISASKNNNTWTIKSN